MRKSVLVFLAILFLVLLASPFPSFGYWEWTPKTQRWINPKYAVKETPEEQFAWAEEFVARKEYATAIRKLEQLIEVFPSSPLAAKARYRIGEVYQMAGQEVKAFKAYQKVIANYPSSEWVVPSVTRQLEIGEQMASQRPRWYSFFRENPSELLGKTISLAPYAPDADKALFEIGNYHYRSGHYQESIQSFDRLISEYPESKYLSRAEFQAALAGLKLYRKQKNNEDLLLAVSERLASFLARYPDAPEKDTAQKLYHQTRELLAEKVLEVAQFYQRTGNKKAATIYYQRVIENFPETETSQRAKEMLER